MCYGKKYCHSYIATGGTGDEKEQLIGAAKGNTGRRRRGTQAGYRGDTGAGQQAGAAERAAKHIAESYSFSGGVRNHAGAGMRPFALCLRAGAARRLCDAGGRFPGGYMRQAEPFRQRIHAGELQYTHRPGDKRGGGRAYGEDSHPGRHTFRTHTFRSGSGKDHGIAGRGAAAFSAGLADRHCRRAGRDSCVGKRRAKA